MSVSTASAFCFQARRVAAIVFSGASKEAPRCATISTARAATAKARDVMTIRKGRTFIGINGEQRRATRHLEKLWSTSAVKRPRGLGAIWRDSIFGHVGPELARGLVLKPPRSNRP